MAGKGGCVNGTLVTELYTSPIPFVGLYIAVATSVCFICMIYDLVYGLFRRKTEQYLPCRWFPMNAFTLTVLAVATKIPNDLVTTMPRPKDQLSKLTSTALLCTAIVFYMPSVGTMKPSERYGNLAALSVIVITMVVNVCIQIHTGVIFAFTMEHIIIISCMVVLLLLMWSSAIALRDQIDFKSFVARHFLHDFKDEVKDDIQRLRDLVGRADTFNYTFDPQTMLCRIPIHHIFGLLYAVSLVVFLQSMWRYWHAHERIETCITADTVSDYKWSIPVVIWSQFLTIVVGSFCIICRWLSLLRHSNKRLLEVSCPFNLRLNTMPLIRFLNKRLCNVAVVVKNFFMDYMFIPIHNILYKCNIFLAGKKIHYVIHLFFREHWEYSETDVYVTELRRYRDSCKRDCPINLMALIFSCCPPGSSSSEYAPFMGELEATGRSYLVMIGDIVAYKYRVSCVSVLVLSGMLTELMPPSSRVETVKRSLKEAFEIIYFVDQRTHTPIWDNERRWMSTQEVWAHWENPTHWFRTEIISKFNLKEFHDLEVLRDTLGAIEIYFQGNQDRLRKISDRDSSLTEKHMALVSIEFAIICKFLREQSESAEDLFDFLEMCLVKMLCFTLSTFPLAILNELDVDDPYEIGEGRTRKCLKYCYKLDFLSDNIKWSWQLAKSGHSAAAASDAVAVGNGTTSDIGSNDEEVSIAMSASALNFLLS